MCEHEANLLFISKRFLKYELEYLNDREKCRDLMSSSFINMTHNESCSIFISPFSFAAK